MSYLILVRHTESKWNKKGLWTGCEDIDLSEEGRLKAQEIAQSLQDYKFDLVYISTLKRSQHTLEEILKVTGQHKIPITQTHALDERNYGTYTGKNKWDIEKEVGEEKFQQIRRGWDVPLPEGETLKDVYERVVPYYKQDILPQLQNGKNVLVVAHGNSLRALTKYLKNLTEEEITHLEFNIGEIHIYQIDHEGKVTNFKIISS